MACVVKAIKYFGLTRKLRYSNNVANVVVVGIFSLYFAVEEIFGI